MTNTPLAFARRPLKSRGNHLARVLARWLGSLGVTPNQVSMMSLVFATVGALCMCLTPYMEPTLFALLWLGAALCIQLRLLCNLMDGLMAIEGGQSTKSGELFNEIPDRFADIVLFIATGYAIDGFEIAMTLGAVAAMLAVLTAYVRLLGGALGLEVDFSGPMAKQHRMAVLTIACLLSISEPWYSVGYPSIYLMAALWIIIVGSVLTLFRRIWRIYKNLEQN